MLTCRICLRDFKKPGFKTDHIAICGRCITDLNESPEPARHAEARLGELLRKGMVKRGTTNFKAEYDRALPGWLNRLLASDDARNAPDKKRLRAHRRGLLRFDGTRRWDYPADWTARANGIRDRDGKQCRACGATNTTLNVHHIVYLSNYGTNQQHNLITLCRPCHEKEHGRTFDWAEHQEPNNPTPIKPQPTHRPSPAEAEVLQVQELERAAEHRHQEQEASAWSEKWAQARRERDRAITAEQLHSHQIIAPPVAPPVAPPPPAALPSQHPDLAPPPRNSPPPQTNSSPPPTFGAPQSGARRRRTAINLYWALAATIAAPVVVVIFKTSIATTPAPDPIPPVTRAPAAISIDERMSAAAELIQLKYPYIATSVGGAVRPLIVAERDRLIAAGIPPDQALLQAADRIAPTHAPAQLRKP